MTQTHLPCPCGKSSDAYTDYGTHGHCFSCGEHFGDKKEKDLEASQSKQYVAMRGIPLDVFEKYRVYTLTDAEGNPKEVHFPYQHGELVRSFAHKKFWATGQMSLGQLFGMELFPPGSAKAITITEGGFDAMAAHYMLGSKYPVVSVRSSTMAKADAAACYDYLNSFEELYLCLDADEPGQKAVREIASLFDFNKVKHVKMPLELKDANAFLMADKTTEFVRVWYNSKRFMPDAIISSYSDFDDIIDNDQIQKGVEYPWPRLQQMTYGMRPGEFVLLTAQEGIGKTEVVRALEYHVLKNTDARIGIIHLEEPKARSIKGLIGYELKAPVHLPDSTVSKEEMKRAFRVLTRMDDRVHVYSHFGSDDPGVILGMVQFLAGPCGCSFIFLDHISMVVSGLGLDDERQSLDFISTRLKMLAESLGVTLVCVSHVNDEGKTRGSRNISKVADLHVYLDRQLEAESEEERNKTHLLVRKNRFGAQTGPAGVLVFDRSTFTLSAEDDNFGVPPASINNGV